MLSRYHMFLCILLYAGCDTGDHDSKLKIVGGEDLPTMAVTPAVSFVMKGSSVGGAFKAETCSGVRVNRDLFLTTLECGKKIKDADKKISLMTTGGGKAFNSLSVSLVSSKVLPSLQNPDKVAEVTSGIALFKLSTIPADMNDYVSIAKLTKDKIKEGQKVIVYGGGCDEATSNGVCKSTPTAISRKVSRFLKTTLTQENTIRDFNGLPFVYLNALVDGFIAYGDQGGPVITDDENNIDNQKLLALNIFVDDNFSPMPTATTKGAFLWLGSESIQSFISLKNPPPDSDATPLPEVGTIQFNCVDDQLTIEAKFARMNWLHQCKYISTAFRKLTQMRYSFSNNSWETRNSYVTLIDRKNPNVVWKPESQVNNFPESCTKPEFLTPVKLC